MAFDDEANSNLFDLSGKSDIIDCVVPLRNARLPSRHRDSNVMTIKSPLSAYAHTF
jgi:hypothetical protein